MSDEVKQQTELIEKQLRGVHWFVAVGINSITQEIYIYVTKNISKKDEKYAKTLGGEFPITIVKSGKFYLC